MHLIYNDAITVKHVHFSFYKVKKKFLLVEVLRIFFNDDNYIKKIDDESSKSDETGESMRDWKTGIFVEIYFLNSEIFSIYLCFLG